MPAERTDPLDGFDLRHLPAPFHVDRCPDRLDLAPEPDRHLAFGLGVHQCAEQGLARLDGRVAIARFPAYRPADLPVRGGRARCRGFLSVPVRLT